MNLPIDLDAQFEVSTAYRIRHTTRLFDSSNPTLADEIQADPTLIVIDNNVDNLYGSSLREYITAAELGVVEIVRIDPRECEKTWGQVERVLGRMVFRDFPRHGIVLVIGGGVTLDIGGFAASVYRRGIRHVRVPTTLLGHVDAGIGIKQAINYGGKKNAIGSFHAPAAVINDRTFLTTLDRRNVLSGVAEIVKVAIVLDKVLFDALEHTGRALVSSHFQEPFVEAQQVLALAERILLHQITSNPREHSLQRLADFGHTFSPAIESTSGFTVTHGEAVAQDMLLSTAFACVRRACSEQVLARIIRLYLDLGLSVDPISCTLEQLLCGLQSARAHRAGNLNLVVPTAIGSAIFVEEVFPHDIEVAMRLCEAVCYGLR